MPLYGEAKREYDRLYIAKRRAEWFEGKHCVKCGSEGNLEIHHVDPSTKVAHQVWTWAKERRLAELEKCEVLCCDCHKVETMWQQLALKHGTRTMYLNHKCRCAACVEFASNYRTKQRLTSGRKHQASYKRQYSSTEEQGACTS
jgi:hypothetical protein